MLKQRLAFAFLLTLTAWWGLPVSAQPVQPGVSARHSLWSVDGVSNRVYLLGSIHVLKEENYPLPPVILGAYTNSQVVVLEADIGQMESAGTQAGIMQKAMLPAGQTLQEELPPGLYLAFSNHAAAAGLPMLVFEHMKPSMAALVLMVAELNELGFDPDYGLDRYFWRRARKDRKTIVPLETVEFQIGLATDFSKEEGELVMKTTLDEIDAARKESEEIVRAWETGDAVKLEGLLNEARTEAPVIFKRLVSDRNSRWVPKIEELLRNGQNTIVIVGAAHLVGQDGVVALLRRNGRKVTQW